VFVCSGNDKEPGCLLLVRQLPRTAGFQGPAPLASDSRLGACEAVGALWRVCDAAPGARRCLLRLKVLVFSLKIRG
jgi:hypothetical protein